MQDLEQTIRERAYHLWILGGGHDGEADKFWLAAQREILAVAVADASVAYQPAIAAPAAPAAESKYPSKNAKRTTPSSKHKRRAA